MDVSADDTLITHVMANRNRLIPKLQTGTPLDRTSTGQVRNGTEQERVTQVPHS